LVKKARLMYAYKSGRTRATMTRNVGTVD